MLVPTYNSFSLHATFASHRFQPWIFELVSETLGEGHDFCSNAFLRCCRNHDVVCACLASKVPLSPYLSISLCLSLSCCTFELSALPKVSCSSSADFEEVRAPSRHKAGTHHQEPFISQWTPLPHQACHHSVSAAPVCQPGVAQHARP